MFLDKRVEDDKDYGFSIFKPNSDACMKWLNDHPKGSVVYVSFGSLASLNVEQMEELAWGLRKSNSFFLWVVRASEKAKLPKNFVEETSDKGLVVHWCPQLECHINGQTKQRMQTILWMFGRWDLKLQLMRKDLLGEKP
ncbi:UDP-glycosyltransferase 74E2 [Fagus crenata]